MAWKRALRQCAENLEDVVGLALASSARLEDVLDQYPDKRLLKVIEDMGRIRVLVAGIRARMDPRQGTLWEEDSG